MSSKLKIVHFSRSFLPVTNGAEIVAHNLALYQQALGHKVYVMTTKGNWSKIRKKIPYNVIPMFPKTRIAFSCGEQYWRLKKLYFALQILWYQKVYQFDIWNIHMGYPSGVALISILNKLNVPAVVTSHGNDIQRMESVGYGCRLDPKIDEAFRKAVPLFDGVVAISRSIEGEYEQLKISPDRIYKIPNGTNVNKIQSVKIDRTEIRKKYNLPENVPIIVTVGRNHPKKGFKWIPEILNKVLQSVPDAVWLLVGQDNEAIMELANEQGVGHRFRTLVHLGQDIAGSDPYMLPSVPLVEVLKACDLFVFPTIIEAAGLVVVEAMSAGLPVVMTNAPGIVDYLPGKGDALLSEVGDVESMASNIIRLLLDQELRESMASRGLQLAKKYEWDNIARMYIDCYRDVIEKISL